MNDAVILNRRKLFGGAVLSAAGLSLAFGMPATAAAKKGGNAQNDIGVLNTAIALEHEGIAAYTLGAGSGLLQPAVLKVGVTFRGHHQRHRDEMIKAVRTLGGTPPEAKPDSEYAADLDAASLKSQEDVLRLALKLERGATNAYLGLIPVLSSPERYYLAARMAGDEAYHVAVLANALGEPIPSEGLIFGA